MHKSCAVALLAHAQIAAVSSSCLRASGGRSCVATACRGTWRACCAPVLVPMAALLSLHLTPPATAGARGQEDA